MTDAVGMEKTYPEALIPDPTWDSPRSSPLPTPGHPRAIKLKHLEKKADIYRFGDPWEIPARLEVWQPLDYKAGLIYHTHRTGLKSKA